MSVTSTFASSYVTATFPVSKSTSTVVTPSRFFRASSTDDLQCPHDIPLTLIVIVFMQFHPLSGSQRKVICNDKITRVYRRSSFLQILYLLSFYMKVVCYYIYFTIV